MFHVRDGKFKEATHNDVIMALEEIETVRYGQPYKIRVKLHNLSTHSRTLKALVKTSSIHYNGVQGQLIRKSGGEFVMGPGQRKDWINKNVSKFVHIFSFLIVMKYFLMLLPKFVF